MLCNLSKHNTTYTIQIQTLRGDLDDARDILAASIKLKPEVDSLARYRSGVPMGNARYWALREKTVIVGLRRAGIPDE